MHRSLRRFLDRGHRALRITGPPMSANGASSFHLWWAFEPAVPPLIEVAVDITVVIPPRDESLYFWALQTSFLTKDPISDQLLSRGAGHVGLQHHPRHHPDGSVNWGGYHADGGELSGSPSPLPSATGNVNTRDYTWRPGRRYRYRVSPSPESGWRASVTDVATGEETVIRDLWVDAHHLGQVVMWSEVFAPCDAPSVSVRWASPQARTIAGDLVTPVALVANYQAAREGGCTNTDARVDGDGVVQTTNTRRLTPAGARLVPDRERP